MTLKITLTIDQESEQGTVLIGLLAKAFGRGEAGVSDLRIERVGERVSYATGRADGLALKAVEKAARKIATAPKPRQGYALGMRSMQSGKPSGVIIALRWLANGGGELRSLREAWAAGGLNSDGGVGATLSKLGSRGLVKRTGPGEWKILPKGVETLKAFEETHGTEMVRHDGAGD